MKIDCKANALKSNNFCSFLNYIAKMTSDFGNPLRKFKLVFLGEQSGKYFFQFIKKKSVVIFEQLCLNLS